MKVLLFRIDTVESKVSGQKVIRCRQCGMYDAQFKPYISTAYYIKGGVKILVQSCNYCGAFSPGWREYTRAHKNILQPGMSRGRQQGPNKSPDLTIDYEKRDREAFSSGGKK